MLAANKVLRGRYRIIRQLGPNETGAVYKAFDSVRETNVALKEIIIDLDTVPTATEREILKREFANQAKNLAKVKHESLPQLRGYFSEIDRHYLVMELVEGEDTGELLAKNKSALALADAANWADQLLDTLDYLHTLAPPIIHGDIKPQNVLLTARGKIKLVGFDITAEDTNAKINAPANQNSAAILRYSSLEQVLRTVNPTSQKAIMDKHGEKIEKILSRPIDARSDVYALGATLYHLVTGQLPLAAMERTFSIWADKPDPLISPDQINSDVPIEVSEVLMKALEIESENRFDSAMEMRENLQTAIKHAKERETEDAKKHAEEAALEIRQTEQKRLAEERQKIEQERLKLETEQKRQSELIAQQLQVAEAERLKAEQRAAEAEKMLLEKDSKKSVNKNSSAEVVKSADDSAQTSSQTNNSYNKSKQTSASDNSKDLFTEPKTENKSSWLMPAAVVIFLLIGGVAAGAIFMRSPGKVEANQAISGQTTSTTDKSIAEPKVEAAPPTIAEIPSDTSTAPTTSVAADSDKTPVVQQSSLKNKPATVQQPTPTRVVKPVAPPPTKAPANQKKAVTVDDLIN